LASHTSLNIRDHPHNMLDPLRVLLIDHALIGRTILSKNTR
jgi:hypothetical protein